MRSTANPRSLWLYAWFPVVQRGGDVTGRGDALPLCVLGRLGGELARTGEVGHGGRVPDGEHVGVIARLQRVVDDQPPALHSKPDFGNERGRRNARGPHDGAVASVSPLASLT